MRRSELSRPSTPRSTEPLQSSCEGPPPRERALLLHKDDQIRHQEMLTEECHHRLLNNLQMIVASLSMQSRKEANAEAASRPA